MMPISRDFLFDALLENSPEAIIVTDLDRRIQLVNNSFSKLLGYSLDELKGKLTQLLYADEKDREVQCAVQYNPTPINTKTIRNIDYVSKHGRLICGQTVSTRIFNDQNQVIGYLALIRDVSNILSLRQSIEEANTKTRQAEKRYETIYRKTPAMLHSVNTEGIIVEASEHWLQVMGYERDEVIGRKSTDFLTGDSKKKSVQVLKDFWKDGRCDNIAYQTITKSGDILDILLSGVVDYDTDGKPQQSLAILNDVTELRRAQREAELQRERAEAANVAKTQFLAAMSHELRTPLNGIIGMAQALQKQNMRADHSEMIEVIAESGKTLLALLNDILDISKIESGKVEIENVPFHVRTLVQHIVELHQPLLDEKGLDLRLQIEPDADTCIESDPTKIKQIIVNLLSNAIKFTDRGFVSIKIELRDDDSPTLFFEVRDTGIGIPRSSQQQLFSRFVQADSSVTRKYGGTGLGLAICKELTEALGGQISVESKPNLGSSFKVQIPVALAPANAPQKATGSPVSSLDARLQVLVVDDNPLNLKVIEALLELSDWNATFVENGQSAIDCCADNDFDLIMLDIQMPDMDGLTTMKRIRANNAEISRATPPILAMTANTMPEQIEAYLAAGMDGHIAKPVELDDLIETINQVLIPTQFEQPTKQTAG